jgi:hypothetical protein
MTKSNRVVLALHSDTHAGNSLGLINPEVEFEHENENGTISTVRPSLTEFQKYLWELYTEHVNTAFDIADKSPLYVAHLGDVTQGIAHIDNLVSTLISSHIKIAVSNEEPWFSRKKKPVAYWQMYGTGSHVMGEGTAEKLLVSQLKLQYPSVKFEAMYHAYLDFMGCILDLSHHGPAAGSRKWLEGNSATWATKSQMIDDLMMMKSPPHLIARGHVHEYRHVIPTIYTGDDREFVTHFIILPSYCGLGDYGVKATRSAHLIQNGMVIVEIENGRVIGVTPLVKTIDVRQKRKIE